MKNSEVDFTKEALYILKSVDLMDIDMVRDLVKESIKPKTPSTSDTPSKIKRSKTNKNICAQSMIQKNEPKIKKAYNRNHKIRSPQQIHNPHKPMFKEMIDKTQDQNSLYTKNYKKALEYINNRTMAVSSSYISPGTSPNKTRKMLNQTSRDSQIYDTKIETFNKSRKSPIQTKHMMNREINKHIHAQNGLMAELEFDDDNSYETENPIPHVPIPISPDNSSLENLKSSKSGKFSYRNNDISKKH